MTPPWEPCGSPGVTVYRDRDRIRDRIPWVAGRLGKAERQPACPAAEQLPRSAIGVSGAMRSDHASAHPSKQWSVPAKKKQRTVEAHAAAR